MATIINPSPVQSSTFSGMWVRDLTILFPVSGSKGALSASLLPYDGTNLLATGGVCVREMDLVKSVDPKISALLETLILELNRLLGKEAEWRMLRVVASSPALPVVVVAAAPGGVNVRVPDAFEKASEDPMFASAFQTAMGIVALLAGLSIN